MDRVFLKVFSQPTQMSDIDMASGQNDDEQFKVESKDAISTSATDTSLLSTDEHFFDLPTFPEAIDQSPAMVSQTEQYLLAFVLISQRGGTESLFLEQRMVDIKKRRPTATYR